ncbi:hypothetical protein [Bacillus massiliigorillae]|uniref:hypothetical protein n=1 Tax=Bacillus massiliigorillae TaxID=1243664 RepID=UPI0003A957CF|nr:hypothetical protein [Bacillus massiliigorillae]
MMFNDMFKELINYAKAALDEDENTPLFLYLYKNQLYITTEAEPPTVGKIIIAQRYEFIELLNSLDEKQAIDTLSYMVYQHLV